MNAVHYKHAAENLIEMGGHEDVLEETSKS